MPGTLIDAAATGPLRPGPHQTRCSGEHGCGCGILPDASVGMGACVGSCHDEVPSADGRAREGDEEPVKLRMRFAFALCRAVGCMSRECNAPSCAKF
jgi:hypothetical protein